nr:RNA-dependent RNA polymerase 6-like [Tanacetum cinerariifolium]
MSVDDDEKKLIFKRLMIYYLFEEVLLSEANSNRVPRAKIWQFAEDLEKVETENNGCVGEHSFEGSMAVLEAVIYKRIELADLSLSDVIDSEPEAPPTHSDEANDDASNDGDEARAPDGPQPNPPDVASEAGLRRSTRDKRKKLPFSPVEVPRHEVDLELKDTKRNNYLFSHGMGKMSPKLAVEVAEKL